MSTGEKVIWRSKYYPEMTMTERQLEVLRYAYPGIIQFEPELRRAEAWLYANPDRVPKKNWKSFINNWMRIAEEKSKREAIRHPAGYGDSARALAKDAVPLRDLLETAKQRAAEDNQPIPSPANKKGARP